MILPRDTIIDFDDGTTIKLSEHSRAELALTPLRIENKKRMVDGTLRKNVIATKWQFSTSWNLLPSLDAQTVDGNAGAAAMRAFYLANDGVFAVTLRYTDESGVQSYDLNMMFSDFSYTVVKRSTAGFDLVNVSMALEEV